MSMLPDCPATHDSKIQAWIDSLFTAQFNRAWAYTKVPCTMGHKVNLIDKVKSAQVIYMDFVSTFWRTI